MQPYFFPYIGYWQLMNYVDKWIFFDDIQFRKKTWINRNRISTNNDLDSEQYICVPLKKSYLKKINEIDINISHECLHKTLKNKFIPFKNIAPGFNDVINIIDGVFGKIDPSNLKLSHILFISILEVKKSLSIKSVINLQTDIDYNKNNINGPGDWAFEITKSINGCEYINPISGKFLFSKDKFNLSSIKLSFFDTSTSNKWLKNTKINYSILDLILWNGISNVRSHLMDGFIVSK